jgi:hypothetical protein
MNSENPPHPSPATVKVRKVVINPPLAQLQWLELFLFLLKSIGHCNRTYNAIYGQDTLACPLIFISNIALLRFMVFFALCPDVWNRAYLLPFDHGEISMRSLPYGSDEISRSPSQPLFCSDVASCSMSEAKMWRSPWPKCYIYIIGSFHFASKLEGTYLLPSDRDTQ